MTNTNTYRVWNLGEYITITEGQTFFVGRCGSGRTVFGENAKLIGSTKTQLIFETESGKKLKTKIDDLETIGKARKCGWFVSINLREEGEYIKNNFSTLV